MTIYFRSWHPQCAIAAPHIRAFDEEIRFAMARGKDQNEYVSHYEIERHPRLADWTFQWVALRMAVGHCGIVANRSETFR